MPVDGEGTLHFHRLQDWDVAKHCMGESQVVSVISLCYGDDLRKYKLRVHALLASTRQSKNLFYELPESIHDGLFTEAYRLLEILPCSRRNELIAVMQTFNLLKLQGKKG